jgi:hypothetical protein
VSSGESRTSLSTRSTLPSQQMDVEVDQTRQDIRSFEIKDEIAPTLIDPIVDLSNSILDQNILTL